MINKTNTLELVNIREDEGELLFDYQVDRHSFRTEVYYDGIRFSRLRAQYGNDCIESLIFHIAFLEGMKYCSLVPRFYDVSRFSRFLNPDLVKLFSVLFNNIFAQHKYENNLHSYNGPTIRGSIKKEKNSVQEIKSGRTPVLFSCGGGKDSLVSMKLLERAHIPYSVGQYSHSIYGKYDVQQKLIDTLISVSKPRKQHRVYVVEDFLSGPVLTQHYAHKIRTVCAPETPSGVFEMLPIMLAFGYTSLCVGHERSADTGNFYWKKVGSEINHQWGKSFEAERILNRYIRSHIFKNVQYFSILKPIYDFLIFQLLRKDQKLITATQSCNVEKPWCRRCPKCVYVWLNFMAYLDMPNIFGENLFDEPSVRHLFLQMMGLEKHRPFECIGEIGETRLALFACVQKKLSGSILDIFKKKIMARENVKTLFKKYGRVYRTNHSIPRQFKDKIFAQFIAAQNNARHLPFLH